jgi:hypothetical protein
MASYIRGPPCPNRSALVEGGIERSALPDRRSSFPGEVPETPDGAVGASWQSRARVLQAGVAEDLASATACLWVMLGSLFVGLPSSFTEDRD